MQLSLTEGKLLPSFIKYSIPLLVALLLQSLYGAVDLLVVGQFGDATGVSAVSTGSQIIQSMTGIITGLTMGPTILIAQYLGAKKEDEAAKIVGATIFLFAIIGIILTIVMLLFSNPFVTFMQAPKEAFDQTYQYVIICGIGMIFIVAYNTISSIFRGIGDSKSPLLFVLIACIANIIGDLILVGIFHLDVAGAAIATVFAQAISVVLSLLIIKYKGLPFAFNKHYISFNKAITWKIIKLGAPIALQNILTSISFLVITALLNAMGLIASAAVGVSEKIVSFIFLVPSAFMSSISSFVAQNVGAKNQERAKQSMKYGMTISFVFGAGMFIITYLFGSTLAKIFTNDQQVIASATLYLKAYAIDCVLVCILFSFMGYLNGYGETVFVMIQGLASTFIVRIPFSWLMSRQVNPSMFNIGLAAPLATIFSIILTIILFKSKHWKNILQSHQLDTTD